MNEKLAKILTYVTGLIGMIGFIFFIRIVMAGDEAIVEDEALQNGILSPFITFSIIALVATAGIAIIYSLLNLFKHPDVLKRTLLGVVALAVLFVLAYVIADSNAVTDQLGAVLEGGEAGSGSKMISALINFSLILGAIGLGFFVFDFVKGLVK